MSDPAKKMSTKVGTVRSVLGLWTVANAVGQDRLELVVEHPANIGMAIDHDAGQLLAKALTHETALLKMQIEAFFGGDHRHRDLETSGQSMVAGIK